MKNIIERTNDILSIISSLDISPTMYKNAVEKYMALSKFLEDCGIDADIYPQGSFAIGTVVRPNAKDPSAGYDLDFICQIKGNRNDYTPSELRRKMMKALTSSEVYSNRLKVYKECFTIEYADVNGVGFSIDVVPATDESFDNKNRLASKNQYPELIQTAIVIPKHNGDCNYNWLTNNPRGFKTWFDRINEPFLEASRNSYLKSLFEKNRGVFNSIEEILQDLDRSALQRVIQILKYHRDVYYSHFKDGDDIKPISAILNVVVARIASHYSSSCTVFELLEYVLKELDIYAQQQYLSFEEFVQKYEGRTVFSRPDRKWYIANPANPEDNLANKWNENDKIAEYFFRWIKVAKKDLIDGLYLDDDSQFRASLENGFGKGVVSKILGEKYSGITVPRAIDPKTVAKPFGGL